MKLTGRASVDLTCCICTNSTEAISQASFQFSFAFQFRWFRCTCAFLSHPRSLSLLLQSSVFVHIKRKNLFWNFQIENLSLCQKRYDKAIHFLKLKMAWNSFLLYQKQQCYPSYVLVSMCIWRKDFANFFSRLIYFWWNYLRLSLS